jgi:hypothetical protein
MLRRTVGAALVLFVLGTFVLAGEYNGLITELKKDSVTITVFKKGAKKGEKGKGEKKTFKVTKDTKFQRAGGKKDAEPKSITAEDVTKAIEKGFPKGKDSDERIKAAFGKIETTGEGDKETATSITIRTFGKGGGKKKKKDDN